MIKAVLLFIVGLVLLIKGGDWFVDGATGIAKKFNIPDILIGATVVSIGTTLPEVMVSANAALDGQGAVAYGNALGSIICNTALISAITMAVRPGLVEKKTLKTPVLFFFGAAVFYAISAYVFGFFYRWTGIVLLVAFLIYIAIVLKQAKGEMQLAKSGKSDSVAVETVGADTNNGAKEGAASGADDNDEATEGAASGADDNNGAKEGAASDADDNNGATEGAASDADDNDEASEKEHPIWLNVVLIVVGAVLIAIGADLLVDNGIIIASMMGVPSTVIALTFVALGTSLPELVTAITSLAKGHGALSLGNVIGANLFNLVLVSGCAISLNPFKVPADHLIGNMNASLVLDIPLVFAVMLILTVPPLVKGKLFRWQGITLLITYFTYIVMQFVL